MTISTTSVWEPTRDQTIRQALLATGLLHVSQQPSADLLAFGAECYCEGLEAIQARGIILQRLEMVSLSLTAGSATVSVTTGTVDVELGVIVRSSASVGATDRMLDPMSLENYQAIPNKTTQGQPMKYYPSKSATGTTLYLWPVPTSDWPTLIVPRIRPPADLDTGAVTADCPKKMILAMKYFLAQQFSLHFKQHNAADRFGKLFELEIERQIGDETIRGGLDVTFTPAHGEWR